MLPRLGPKRLAPSRPAAHTRPSGGQGGRPGAVAGGRRRSDRYASGSLRGRGGDSTSLAAHLPHLPARPDSVAPFRHPTGRGSSATPRFAGGPAVSTERLRGGGKQRSTDGGAAPSSPPRGPQARTRERGARARGVGPRIPEGTLHPSRGLGRRGLAFRKGWQLRSRWKHSKEGRDTTIAQRRRGKLGAQQESVPLARRRCRSALAQGKRHTDADALLVGDWYHLKL